MWMTFIFEATYIVDVNLRLDDPNVHFDKPV